MTHSFDKKKDSKTERVNNPFDSLFKKFMANPDNARDFFAIHLPAEILTIVNNEQLELCPQSFVDNKLKHKHVDVLYKTKFNDETGYIYLLTEQQTKPDKHMPLRIMQYVLRIIDMHRQQFNTEDYPVIYPLIFYVGNKPYGYSTDFYDGFGKQNELARNILTNSFQIANVVGVTDEQLLEHPLAGTLSKIYQIAFARDMINELKSLKSQFWHIDSHYGSDLIISMLEFILNRTEGSNAHEIITIIESMVTEETGEKIMTLSQQLIDEGFQQGIQQGMQQGMQQGILQNKCQIAEQMLLEKMDVATIVRVTGLNFQQVDELRRG